MRLTLPPDVRRAVEREQVRAYLTTFQPKWVAGDKVTVTRGWAGDVQDKPLIVAIDSVEALYAQQVTREHAQLLGHRTLLDWQREWTGRTTGHQLVVETAVKRASGILFLTRWTAELPDVPRILASTLGYTVSLTSPQMRSAGEAVPADYQEILSAGPSAAWSAERAERAARARRVAEAKRKLAFNESTRRSRVRVARTANSQVQEEQRDAS